MSMVINHNLPADKILNHLNKHNSAMQKSLEQVATGVKTGRPGEDPAAYSISEGLRVQLRSLDQDMHNIQDGNALLNVAANGIENIVDNLRHLKELAVNSANDFNSETDRRTLQKEFEQTVKTIDEIASFTNYDTKYLLDGTYQKKNNSTSDNSLVIPKSYALIEAGVAEPTGTVTNIASGDYTISSDGVYSLSNGYSGTITINAQNVKLQQASTAVLNNVYIEGSAGGNANLWIEGLNVNNTSTDKSFIKFQGTDNVLTIKGENTFQGVDQLEKAVINVGGGLTVQGNSNGQLNIKASSNPDDLFLGAVIGSDLQESSTANITVNSGIFNVTTKLEGALIGSGDGASIGNVTVNGGTFKLSTTKTENDPHHSLGAVIGSGRSDNITNSLASAGDITVKNAIIEASTCDAVIGGGYFKTQVGNITIDNTKITADTNDGGGIGSGAFFSSAGNIQITNSDITIKSETGAGIGSGANSTVGNISIDNTILNLESEQGDETGAGYNGTAGTVSITNEISDETNDSNASVNTGKSLIIHTGTQGGQHLKIFINDLRTAAMTTGNLFDDNDNLKNERDILNYSALNGDTEKQTNFISMLKEADGKTIEDANIFNQHDANVAIRIIDGALDYALDEASNIGAYLKRLEHTYSNVVTTSENIQAAESNTRDADMSQSMREYALHKLLTQSSQAMLAQANQDSSNVLGLLQ